MQISAKSLERSGERCRQVINSRTFSKQCTWDDNTRLSIRTIGTDLEGNILIKEKKGHSLREPMQDSFHHLFHPCPPTLLSLAPTPHTATVLFSILKVLHHRLILLQDWLFHPSSCLRSIHLIFCLPAQQPWKTTPFNHTVLVILPKGSSQMDLRVDWVLSPTSPSQLLLGCLLPCPPTCHTSWYKIKALHIHAEGAGRNLAFFSIDLPLPSTLSYHTSKTVEI